jgi:amidase
MNSAKPISIQKSGAFVEVFTLEPSGSGILDGLTFAVKDLIDIKGHKTGCGNPTWRDTHPEPRSHAVCIDQLLIAGARCIGKTVTDELAFSLMGENHFYGTPLNPKAPDRVPGGSSSGSASAVACGLADFAIGTDTGGSVRIPASNCGIFGFRPSHGLISLAGVNPLSPSLDTVGVFAARPDVLSRAASVLLGTMTLTEKQPGTVHLIQEAFALSDPAVRKALEPSLQLLREFFGNRVREISIREIDGETEFSDLKNWNEIYRVLQRAEAESCLGGWVAANNPTFGTLIAESFELMRTVDRNLIGPMSERRSK